MSSFRLAWKWNWIWPQKAMKNGAHCALLVAFQTAEFSHFFPQPSLCLCCGDPLPAASSFLFLHKLRNNKGGWKWNISFLCCPCFSDKVLILETTLLQSFIPTNRVSTSKQKTGVIDYPEQAVHSASVFYRCCRQVVDTEKRSDCPTPLWPPPKKTTIWAQSWHTIERTAGRKNIGFPSLEVRIDLAVCCCWWHDTYINIWKTTRIHLLIHLNARCRTHP